MLNVVGLGIALICPDDGTATGLRGKGGST